MGCQLVIQEAADARFVETALLYLKVFGSHHVLVLSTAELVLEFLDRRSAVYSDGVSAEKASPL